MENETEEIIKKYVKDGGKLFYVKGMDGVRDGGTKVIHASEDLYFYIEKEVKSLHLSYPPKDENLITDIGLKTYLIDRIEAYVKKCQEDVERNKKLLFEIRNQCEEEVLEEIPEPIGKFIIDNAKGFM